MLGTSSRTTVTLSGAVGAGKSSTAKAIVDRLRSAGCPAEFIRFQDFTRLRERRSHALVSKPRRAEMEELDDPDIRWGGYQRRCLTVRVAAGYALRTLLFRTRLNRWPKDTVLVFDRYFYDNLVHFDLQGAGSSLRLLMRVLPVPTVAALLLISEGTILERRPRYSAEYAQQVAEGYEELAKRIPGLLVVRTDDLASVADVAGRIAADVLTRVDRENERVRS